MAEAKSPSVDEKTYILEAHKTSPSEQQGYQGTKNESNEDAQGSSSANNDRKALLQEKESQMTTGLHLASFNYINSIVGSGVIGIAYALSSSGFGVGILLLGLVAVITDYSLVLMVRSAHLSGSFSYQGIVYAAFGQTGYRLLVCLLFIYPFVAMVSYNVVVGDTVTKVLIRVFNLDVRTSIFARRDVVIGLATLFITLPLCLLKDIVKLTKASITSVFFIFFILAAIISRFLTLESIIPWSDDAWRFANWNFIPAIGIMAFAFMCHHNVFLIYGSIKEPNQEKWDKVTHISIAISFVITSLFGIFGYATFTGFAQGDLLENYCWDDDLMNAARIAFSLTILCTFPIECMVIKNLLSQVLTTPASMNFGVVAIVFLTFCISISNDCLGLILELDGVIAAVPLAFIFPAAVYLKLTEGSLLSLKKAPAIGLVLFGFLVAGIGVFLIIAVSRSGYQCSHGMVMPYCFDNFTVNSP